MSFFLCQMIFFYFKSVFWQDIPAFYSILWLYNAENESKKLPRFVQAARKEAVKIY